ncbi:hypothetical protein Tco_1417161 [Tanacetum coccineum]
MMRKIRSHKVPHKSSHHLREIPSVDEPEPQLLPNFLPLDVNLGDKRGTDPPIKPYSPDSFRMKVVDKSTINTPHSPHMASFHPKNTYLYYHPCIDNPKKYYGFKPGLLGQSRSLGRGLNSPVRPKEVEKVRIKETHHLEHIIQQPIFQHVTPSHNNGVHRYYHPQLNSSVGEPSPLSVKEG